MNYLGAIRSIVCRQAHIVSTLQMSARMGLIHSFFDTAQLWPRKECAHRPAEMA